MKELRVLLTDDEPYSRKELAFLLSATPFIRIVGEAASGEEAVMKGIELRPDAVFLDIEMPGMSGIEAAKSLQQLKKAPAIVFATAYPEFAAEAFQLEAVHYILKPFEQEDILRAAERLQKLLAEENPVPVKTGGKFAVESDDGILYIDPDDILYMTKEEKTTKIMTASQSFNVKTPMKELEGKLTDIPLFRIHKSYLVNLKHVLKLTPWFNGAYELVVKGREERLPVSRNYVKELRSRLER